MIVECGIWFTSKWGGVPIEEVPKPYDWYPFGCDDDDEDLMLMLCLVFKKVMERKREDNGKLATLIPIFALLAHRKLFGF